MQYFKHIKTGDIYQSIDLNVINATNGDNDGQIMVAYQKFLTHISDNQVFVRDKHEFLQRFTAIEVNENE